MPKSTLISVVINVRNEAANLEHCLKSISDFANEIIITDMSSTDDSAKIALKYGAKVITIKPAKVVEHARNIGLAKASGKWILLLDPDEYLRKTLKKELLSITSRSDIDFVKIPRMNFIFGKWLRHSNMWPDYLIRFFKKDSVNWKREIHSQPTTKGNGLTLLDSNKLALRHRNYPTVSDFVYRALRYSGVQADELKAQNYKIKLSDLLLKPTQEFNSRFFAAEGFKDGLHGLIFSLLQAFAISLIYIRLWEKNGASEKALVKESFVSGSQESIYEYGYWFSKYFRNEYSHNPIKNLFIKIRQVFNRLTKNY
ncbi:MAG: glycosyltransferase family 2 protein [Candidatus Shapirobacteria bacterium]|nr:glycosyltransferase family 2 protein [Candidatus Shapirobacteria bacterium]